MSWVEDLKPKGLFKFAVMVFGARVTGRMMASLYNRMFTWNSYFRNKAHQNRGFNIPKYDSFFVRKNHVANDFVQFSFPGELVEVVTVDTLNKVAWETWCNANEL